MTAAAGIGIVCLFWAYTVALGICLVVVSLIALFLPHLLPFGARSTYQRGSHLHGTMTCGVSDREMWVHGASFRFCSSWDNLNVWRESDGWVVLSANGMTPVFLEVDQLRKADVYEKVTLLARQHGARFPSRPGSSRV